MPDIFSSPAVVGVIGIFLGFVVRLAQDKRALAEARSDTLRHWRADTYSDFVQAAHVAGHGLGQLARTHRGAELDDSEHWSLDTDVRRHLRIVEMVASDELLCEANSLVALLREFRDAVRDGAEYQTDAYNDAFRPFQEQRLTFARAARADLGIR